MFVLCLLRAKCFSQLSPSHLPPAPACRHYMVQMRDVVPKSLERCPPSAWEVINKYPPPLPSPQAGRARQGLSPCASQLGSGRSSEAVLFPINVLFQFSYRRGDGLLRGVLHFMCMCDQNPCHFLETILSRAGCGHA